MGEAGLRAVERVLPGLRRDKSIDLVIAQSENVSEGRGITNKDYERLRASGIDFCTGGNWSLHHGEIVPRMEDPDEPVIRPANYPAGTPGRGWKYVSAAGGRVLVISLLGQIVGRDAERPMDNPLHIIDRILEEEKNGEKKAVIVNFHGDFSSEKVVIGQYLDGRVTAVVGDHWHVPTADARLLPGGTAHITDVGMCGALNSSLGVRTSIIVQRWHDGIKNRNQLEPSGPYQFNAVLVETNEAGLAGSIEQIQLFLD